ncbi:unnamed protein product [Cylicocyclus nassatus]|uniref:Uncharacterized protein n=1 Tax=Cylicocyclus nassatus TaxID=53992 RepID=A0AA36GHX6_CYLNA|nr:unnamed protein product [Cylicocyclus nassatus]
MLEYIRVQFSEVVHSLYVTLIMREHFSNEIDKGTKKSRGCPYAPNLACKDSQARRTLLLWSLKEMHYKNLDYSCHMEIIAEKVLSGSCFKFNKTFSYLRVSKKLGYSEKVMTKVDEGIAKLRHRSKCGACTASYGCTTDGKKVACAIFLHGLLNTKYNGGTKRKKKQM